MSLRIILTLFLLGGPDTATDSTGSLLSSECLWFQSGWYVKGPGHPREVP